MKSTYTKAYRTLLLRLVAARKESGTTQSQLAKKLGRPQSFVSKIESGERRIDVIEFLEVSQILGVEPCEMISDLMRR